MLHNSSIDSPVRPSQFQFVIMAGIHSFSDVGESFLYKYSTYVTVSRQPKAGPALTMPPRSMNSNTVVSKVVSDSESMQYVEMDWLIEYTFNHVLPFCIDQNVVNRLRGTFCRRHMTLINKHVHQAGQAIDKLMNIQRNSTEDEIVKWLNKVTESLVEMKAAIEAESDGNGSSNKDGNYDDDYNNDDNYNGNKSI